jgi:hypothetical protein
VQGLDLGAYLWVLNVMDVKNAVAVYRYRITDPTDT